MEQPTAIQYPISDILEWHVSKRLIIAPKFQRRDVWSLNAKSYLIDTILRAMPIPPVYMRLMIDPVEQKTTREVVDGQQRLRAVLGYIQDEFPINKNHHPEFGGCYYGDLPEEIRKKFLSYKFTVNVLENINDTEVLAIFARVNSYTLSLNAQEKRNATYFGVFKQTIYKLALQHYNFWWYNKILTNNQIARMRDAELVSTLVVTMLDGIRQTKAADLKEFYELYDEEFPQKSQITTEFETVIDIIGDFFGDTLSQSRFNRIPLFYSLFCVIYDGKFGLPGPEGRQQIKFTASGNRRIAGKIQKVEEMFLVKDPPEPYKTFIDAARRSTADVGRRRLRHEFLWDQILT